MVPIQPRRRRQRQKELAAVRAGPGIGHAENARARVLQVLADLVLKLFTVDAGAAAACACRIAALHHEVLDDAVEDGVVVVAARRESGEVFAGARRVGVVELHGDGALLRRG